VLNVHVDEDDEMLHAEASALDSYFTARITCQSLTCMRTMRSDAYRREM